MFCPRCGTHVTDGQPSCPTCGKPLGVRGNKRELNPPTRELSITFVEDGTVLAQVTLDSGRDTSLSFGRYADNDVVVDAPSGTVSGYHGVIVVENGWCLLRDTHSTNGLWLNGVRQTEFRVAAGDVVSIGRPKRGARRCVIVVGDATEERAVFALAGRQQVTVGREDDNDLALQSPTVSSYHAIFRHDRTGWSIADRGSTNGTQVNGDYVGDYRELYSGSTITFGNVQAVFLDGCLLVATERHGVDVVAQDLVRYRKNGKDTRITTDHVSLHIKRGEFVAIVGGSGCGKSTLLDELSGVEPADEGLVLVDGANLYANYELLKTSIGYVPQQDIVYDDLTLQDMLLSAAKLRMQPDTTEEERNARVDEVVHTLELDRVRDNLIGNLSGGQKKRASIAVELMADPRLLFLDEPTSGLDPGIERKLMQTLASMARDGRTIILVTHTTLNLHLCDQVVFLGTGGKLCYAGRPAGALSFFDVDDFVDVYGKIDGDGEEWEHKFAEIEKPEPRDQSYAAPQESPLTGRRTPSFVSQLATLAGRYAKLIRNDRSRLALLLLQAPLLAALISFVAGSSCFEVFEDTKSCLFALSCAAFWVGILDAIQEICKERAIVSRDCDGGVRLGAYLCSKVVVLGLLCLVQAGALTGVFCAITGTPANPLVNAPLELFVSIFLTTCCAMCLGLLVSALFRNPDRAIAMAPLLIMPQILFSGLVFELEGPSESISYAVTCRWAMEALGTTSDLNALDLALYGKEVTMPESSQTIHDQTIHVPETEVEVDVGGQMVETTVPAEDREFDTLDVTVPEMTQTLDAEMFPHDPEDMYRHEMTHLLQSWGVLAGSSILFVCACLLVLVRDIRR